MRWRHLAGNRDPEPRRRLPEASAVSEADIRRIGIEVRLRRSFPPDINRRGREAGVSEAQDVPQPIEAGDLEVGKRRPFAEHVVAAVDPYDLDAERLGALDVGPWRDCDVEDGVGAQAEAVERQPED